MSTVYNTRLNSIKKIEFNEIKETYNDNYKILNFKFLNFQSSLLSDLYRLCNNDLDSVNIFMYFERSVHKKILEIRLHKLDHDISLKNATNNYNDINQNTHKISDIALATGIPKESTRRKILNLVHKKVLLKFGNKIISPNADTIKLKIILKHIKEFSFFLEYFLKFCKINEKSENLEKKILKNFSFYTFHFLKTQMLYLKDCRNNFQDLDLLLIKIQCDIKIQNQITGKLNVIYDNNKTNIDFTHSTVSASTISLITGIPRASCIRKLKLLCDKKIIKKDFSTKRYYSNIYNKKNSRFNFDNNNKTINYFSEFLFTLLSN